MTNAGRERLEQAWLDHLRAELAQREQFKAELFAEWQRRREQCADDIAKARVRGDLVGYKTALRRWRRYYAMEDEPPPAA